MTIVCRPYLIVASGIRTCRNSYTDTIINIVFIFVEKGVGQEAYKMDARYLPLIGLQGAEVVPDISILEPLLHADEFKVFILQ